MQPELLFARLLSCKLVEKLQAFRLLPPIPSSDCTNWFGESDERSRGGRFTTGNSMHLCSQFETSLEWRSTVRRVCTVSILAAVVASVPVRAVEDDNYTLDYGKLKKNSSAYTFQQATEVKESAAASAKTISSVPPGSVLRVVSETNKQHSVNGFEDCWYQVSTDKISKGFVWGGNLSKSFFKVSADKVLILSIEGKGKDSVEKLGRAFLIKNGSITSQATFKPIELPEAHSYGYSIGAAKFKSDGFSGNPVMVRFYFMYGACDYPNGDILFGITGDKVSFLLDERAYGNEVGSSTYNYLRPSDKGGKPDVLIVDTTVENSEEKKKTKTRETFRWTVDHFVKEPDRKKSK